MRILNPFSFLSLWFFIWFALPSSKQWILHCFSQKSSCYQSHSGEFLGFCTEFSSIVVLFLLLVSWFPGFLVFLLFNLASMADVNDPSSPLFLNPSDYPGNILVSQSFDGTGFGPWKRARTTALSSKNKLVFVDGSCLKPDDSSPYLQQWIRCNNMVISWILNYLTKEKSESVLFQVCIIRFG